MFSHLQRIEIRQLQLFFIQLRPGPNTKSLKAVVFASCVVIIIIMITYRESRSRSLHSLVRCYSRLWCLCYKMQQFNLLKPITSSFLLTLPRLQVRELVCISCWRGSMPSFKNVCVMFLLDGPSVTSSASPTYESPVTH